MTGVLKWNIILVPFVTPGEGTSWILKYPIPFSKPSIKEAEVEETWSSVDVLGLPLSCCPLRYIG